MEDWNESECVVPFKVGCSSVTVTILSANSQDGVPVGGAIDSN